MKQIKKGFTLLELLVVIGIIGLLIGLGAVSFSSAQKKARDAKRKGDVQAIKNIYEQYYSICNSAYPPAGAITATETCTATNPDTTFSNIPTVDPLNNAYVYTVNTSVCANNMESDVASSYCVYLQQ